MATYKITLTKTGTPRWTGGPDALWYDSVSMLFYLDSNMTENLSGGRIEIPTSECFRFTGYYRNGACLIADDGDVGALKATLMESASTMTLSAPGERTSCLLVLDYGSWTDSGTIYRKWTGSDADGPWYDNYLCEGESIVGVPSKHRDGYVFGGFYTSSGGTGSQVIGPLFNFVGGSGGINSITPNTNGTSKLYAYWVSPRVVNIDLNGGTGLSNIYFDHINGIFYSDYNLTKSFERLAVPERMCYGLDGIYVGNGTSQSDMAFFPDGRRYMEWVPESANVTLKCLWSLTGIEIRFNKAGGSGGTDRVFCRKYGGVAYSWGWSSINGPVDFIEDGDKIEIPYRANKMFSGYYSGTNGTGTKYIDLDGYLLPELLSHRPNTNAESVQIFASWLSIFKIEFKKYNMEGGNDALWASPDTGRLYGDARATIPLDNNVYITPPSKECWRFDGYWSEKDGGVEYVTPAGKITSSFVSFAATVSRNSQIFEHATRISFKASLDANGGEAEHGTDVFYYDGSTLAFYADDFLETPVGAVTPPTRTGYTFLGYYDKKTSGGSKYVDADGTILVATALTADVKLYAQWRANTYVLYFDYGSGSGSVDQKTVTYDADIGALPSPSSAPPRMVFCGWFIGGVKITATTVWHRTEDATAVAGWMIESWSGKAKTTDWFNLRSPSLVPIESDSGEDGPRIVTRHYGKYSSGCADAASSLVWLNPTVKYMVVGSVNFVVTMGAAFAGASGYTGYMITSVEIDTRERGFPIVTVRATANEGEPAVNRFGITVSVAPRARAQALLGAIGSGTGHLQACTLRASCDPVVLAENMVPCASDVVNGRIEVSGDVRFDDIRNRVGPSAGSGFALVSREDTGGGTSYNVCRITVRKEL